MGVKGLHYALQKYGGETADLVREAKSKPVVILADYYGFVFYVLETYVSMGADVFLDRFRLGQTELAEYAKIKSIVVVILKVLQQSNIYLEFIADGCQKHKSEEGDTKFTEWKRRARLRVETISQIAQTLRRRDIHAIAQMYRTTERDVPVAQCSSASVRQAILETGCPFWYSDGEADKLIAEICRRREALDCLVPPIRCILSNDSDFAITAGCTLMTSHLIDPERELQRVVGNVLKSNEGLLHDCLGQFKIDAENEDHQLQHFKVSLFSPSSVARKMGLYQASLADLSILLGNDFTKEFVQELIVEGVPNGILPRINVSGVCSTSRQIVSQWLRRKQLNLGSRPVTIEDIPQFARLMANNQAFRKAVAFSHDFYGHSTLKGQSEHLSNDEINDYMKWRVQFEQHSLDNGFRLDAFKISDKDLMLGCCTGWFPKSILQLMQGKTFTTSIGLGIDIDNSNWTIHDSLIILRRCYYGMLGVEGNVTEYGPCGGDFFTTVDRKPIPPPVSLSMKELFGHRIFGREAFHDLTSRFLEFVIKQQNGIDVHIEVITIFEALIVLLSYLRGEGSQRLLSDHEIESVIVSAILCSHRSRNSVAKTETDQELLTSLTLTEPEVIAIQRSLADQQLESDPVGFNKCKTKVLALYPNRNGIIPSYRQLCVFGWVETVFWHVDDIYQSYHAITMNSAYSPQCGLFLDGDIFKWVYAAGVFNILPEDNEASPVHIFPEIHPQLNYVRLLRDEILKTHAAKNIMRSVCIHS